MLLDKRANIIGGIFGISLFLISFFIFNLTSQSAIAQNVQKQLYAHNKQSNELARTKLEKILKYKLEVFTQNLIDSGSLNKVDLDNESLVKLLEYFRSENFIPIIGVLVDDESLFLNENNEQIIFDKNVIYDLLSNNKSIFKYEINNINYLILKNAVNISDEKQLTIISMYKDHSKNNELMIPIYEDAGCSMIIDKDGNSLFCSTVEESAVDLMNIYTSLLSLSSQNSSAIGTLKLDMYENDSGIITYENNGSKRIMSYSPIGFEDLYLCTIIPEEIIINTVNEFKLLNKIALSIMGLDLALLFSFFKCMEKRRNKNNNKILNLDIVTNGNSYKKFQEELKKVHNQKSVKAIFMAIDLDNFKIVNTVLGKSCGDMVLKKIYRILEFYIGDNGCYCRKTADEFLAYYEYNDFQDIEHVVNSICGSIRHIRLPKSHILVPSIGICYMNDKNQSIETLEVNAVIARKKSKNKINEFYSYFKDDNLHEMIDSKSILDDMNQALINDEFKLVFQPKFDPKSRKIVGAEALIRWIKADGSVIVPDQFIPIAEKTGFITFIDSYVFKEVCTKQAEWHNKGYAIVPISINISREKLKDQNFLYEYLKIVSDTGVDKEYIQLEITEGDTYSYDNVKTNIVSLIKDAGFKVLIDDFGVGYSSLTMLKDIRADVLKLDRSFIMDETEAGKAMIKYIIKIAKLFNYKITAEGVETEEQFNLLKEDCDAIQGYYFAKPLEESLFIETYLKKDDSKTII